MLDGRGGWLRLLLKIHAGLARDIGRSGGSIDPQKTLVDGDEKRW